MSKKSRKRNKKILAALALAGGAAMLAKGRGKGIAQGVSGADKAAFTSDAAYKLPSKAAVATDIAADVVSPADATGSYLSKMQGAEPFGGHVGQNKRALRAQVLAAKAAAPKGVMGPFDYMQPRGPIRGSIPGRYKGGGIAKRGTGAAYKSGGRVKSMGIAKRGGGAAKR